MNNMKKVLVYGDSNTWGDNFITRKRSTSWVDLLKDELSDYSFICEGLPGRVAGSLEIDNSYKNGKDTFISVFLSAAPVDIVIIALGSNDLQNKYNRSSREIVKDLLWYEDIISDMARVEDNYNRYFKEDKIPEFIYILPTNFEYIEGVFDENSELKRQEIISCFRNSDKKIIEVNDMSLVDGLHYSEEGHKKMVKLVKEIVESVNKSV